MPNPSGVNGFDQFANEPPYGQISQADRLKQGYPVPGNPALNAPKRLQKQAQRQQRGGQAQTAPPQAAAAPVAPPPPNTADTWAMIASIPGASELVKSMAARAQRG